jgi:hypothetical protein
MNQSIFLNNKGCIGFEKSCAIEMRVCQIKNSASSPLDIASYSKITSFLNNL